MSAPHRKYPYRHALTANDGDRRTARSGNDGHLQSRVARWPGSAPPTIDQDTLTSILLMIVVVLSALDFMLRFPDLGAVIAQYNQF